MSDVQAAHARPKKRAPWRGRMRVKDARNRLINVRCTDHERVAIKAIADRAGLSVGGLLRALALGDAGPRAVRKPPVELRELARLKGEINKIGSNINQLAHGYNRDGGLPGLAEILAIRREIETISAAIVKALGGDH